MKPVVSAAQIAAQAYAQRTAAPARGTPQPGFSVDGKVPPQKAAPAKAPGLSARISRETDAFKIEISAEALEAASRDGGRRSARVARQPDEAPNDVAEVAFQPIDSGDLVSTGGPVRREAPFAHQSTGSGSDEPPRRPGTLLDITI